MKKMIYMVIVTVLLTCFAIPLSSCQENEMRQYYAERSNYLTATGTVAYISFNEDNNSLYIDFSGLMPVFDDTCFKIVGQNYVLVQQRGIEELLHVGDQIEFITAPKYFGDGYVMPIVSVTVDGEIILEFEEGLINFLEWQN